MKNSSFFKFENVKSVYFKNFTFDDSVIDG